MSNAVKQQNKVFISDCSGAGSEVRTQQDTGTRFFVGKEPVSNGGRDGLT